MAAIEGGPRWASQGREGGSWLSVVIASEGGQLGSAARPMAGEMGRDKISTQKQA